MFVKTKEVQAEESSPERETYRFCSEELKSNGNKETEFSSSEDKVL